MAKALSKPRSPTGEPFKTKWLELNDILAAGYSGEVPGKNGQGSSLGAIGSKVTHFHYETVKRVSDALKAKLMSEESPYYQTWHDEHDSNRKMLDEKATQLVDSTFIDMATDKWWPKVSVEALAKMVEEGQLHLTAKTWAKEELQATPPSSDRSNPKPRQR